MPDVCFGPQADIKGLTFYASFWKQETALTRRDRPWRYPAQVRREHRGQRDVDRWHRAAPGTVHYHEPSSGSAHAERLGSPHAGAAAPPATTFLAARPGHRPARFAPYHSPARAAD